MKRRTFIKHTGHLTALPIFLQSFPGVSWLSNMLQMATETDRVLVLIFLNGGNDGLNTVIPVDQIDTLNVLRPHVVMPENRLLRLSGEDKVALHPALSGMRSLFDEGRLQIIQNVGYPDQDYSHFRSTDIWMSGSDSNELLLSGWAGRYLNYEYPNYPQDYPNAEMPDPLAVELGYSGSLLFQGPAANMGMVISDPTWFYRLLENREEEAPDTKAGDKLRYVRLVARQSQLYGEVVKSAAEKVTQQVTYPNDNRLADQLKVVSRLIAGGLKTRLYMVQLGGFDTHDAQVEDNDHTQGEHASLLGQVDAAIAAFMADLRFLGTNERVMGMTFSEFGRRVVSNASLGTDHGSAAPLFVFGDQVSGGILGDNPALDPQMTYVDNLQHQFDFRQVYASVLEQWLCVPESDLGTVLLKNMDRIPVAPDAGCVPTGTRDRMASAGRSYIEVFPNPVRTEARVQLHSIGERVQVRLTDINGRPLRLVHDGFLGVGQHEVNMNIHGLPQGQYILSYQSPSVRQARVVVKLSDE